MAMSRNLTLDELYSNNAVNNYCDVFTSFFLRKSINTIVVRLTEDILKKHNYSPAKIERIKNIIYLTLLTIQGTLHTNGSALGMTEILKYCGYVDDEAYWIGFATGIAINLSLDLTSWGITKTAISTIGSTAGMWCTQWAYEKYKANHTKRTETLQLPDHLIEEGLNLKLQS